MAIKRSSSVSTGYISKKLSSSLPTTHDAGHRLYGAGFVLAEGVYNMEQITVTRQSPKYYYGTDESGNMWNTFHCDPKWSRKCAICGESTNSGYVCGKKYICVSHVNFIEGEDTAR